MTEDDRRVRGGGQRDAAAGTALEDALVARLSMLTEDLPALDDDVRAQQRARLVAMAAVRSPQTRPTMRQRLRASASVDSAAPQWKRRATAGLAAAALTVATLSGLVALSQGSTPGDLLYDVKRGTEQTQLALAPDAARGLTLLGFASTRLSELEALTGTEAGALPVAVAPDPDGSDVVLAAGGPDTGTVRTLLATMDEQTTEGTFALTSVIVDTADPGPLATLDAWTEGQRAGLSALQPVVPEGARADVEVSIAVVDAVAFRSAALRTGFGCPGGLQTLGSDELGPVPAPCSAPTEPAGPSAPPSTVAPSAPGGGEPGPESVAPGTATPSPTPATASTCVGQVVCVGG